MTIQVRYYAVLREQRGLAVEEVTTSAETAGALYQELQARHGLSFDQKFLRVAINQNYVPWTTPLKDGDTIIFIPPVAGG